ncbi:MAG: hypothetical protein ACJ72W_26960 [Actinoallomurus sp.]
MAGCSPRSSTTPACSRPRSSRCRGPWPGTAPTPPPGTRCSPTRFLCPAGRLPELSGALADGDRFDLGLITLLDPETVRRALDLPAGEPRLVLAAVEGPLPSGTDPVEAARQALGVLAELPADLPCHVEVPLTDGWRGALGVLAEGGRGAKVRCGGLRPELFPTVEGLAAFLHACAELGLPFKATAGLHHAVRYRDERTGFTHHGFLNLLLAVCRAVDGGSSGDVAAVLRSADTAALAAEARAVPEHVAGRARTLLVAYGSCSTAEPLEDLQALGLVDKEIHV